MIRLCLFDLDQTLIDTSDLQELREAGRHRADLAYPQEVSTAFFSRERYIINEFTLVALTLQNPGLKIGVFTRSPRRYVDAILAAAYALVEWDVTIAYEDVQNHKPSAEGIYRAMQAVGLNDSATLPDVLMVGDSDVDIRAAYHAGCIAALFKQGWPQAYERTHWRSMGLLPDLILNDESELQTSVANPARALPDLECLLERSQPPPTPRFDEIGKFFPNDRTRHVVFAAGRSFADYRTLDQRRAWHRLSQSILQHKDSVQFPHEWTLTVQRFIAYHYRMISAFPIGPGPELVVTCIPARPERVHRLGHFINQLAASYGNLPLLNRLRLTFDHGLLAYRPGVRSQSRDHLNPAERFENVRDHLHVVNPAGARGRRFLVIDDVTTTGATLLYAKKYLMEAGATSVDCFSLAQNISDPLRLQ